MAHTRRGEKQCTREGTGGFNEGGGMYTIAEEDENGQQLSWIGYSEGWPFVVALNQAMRKAE